MRPGDAKLGNQAETAPRRHGPPEPASPPRSEGDGRPTAQQRRNPAHASPFSPPLMPRPAMPLSKSNDPPAVRMSFTAALDALLDELRLARPQLAQDITRARARGLLSLAADLARLKARVDAVWRAGGGGGTPKARGGKAGRPPGGWRVPGF